MKIRSQWFEGLLRKRMNKNKLKILDELRLCFIYQYPTSVEREYFLQFMFAILLIKKEEKGLSILETII